MSDWIITGLDSAHFANCKQLLASWFDSNRNIPLAIADFGLTPDHAREIKSWPVRFLPRTLATNAIGEFNHAWRAKAALIHYASALGPWKHLVWIDADALLLQPLGNLATLLDGYDLLLDAHRMSLGEIILPDTRA